MTHTPEFDRNVLGATLKRADQLALGDCAIVPHPFIPGRTITVRKLERIGDDVTVNGEFTTSIGNTFIILPG